MQPISIGTTKSRTSTRKAIRNELKRRIGVKRYEHWFYQKTTLRVSGDQLTVGVASPFFLNWIPKQFREPLTLAAAEVLGPSARVLFEVDVRLPFMQKRQAGQHSPKEEPVATPCSQPKSPQPKSTRPKNSRAERASGELKREPAVARTASASYSLPGRRFSDLADFVPGQCNELGLTAAKHVCDHPGDRINPLFVHGQVGVGKTHLLEGIYRELRRKFPDLQVAFLTAEAFTNYFTQSLRSHTLPSFRQRFRSLGALIVDDVDFLAGKHVVEEEFLNTFKQLECHGHQIVLASDRHPRLLPKISAELSTRFLSGLVCRLEVPDFETRLKILERKASRVKADIAPEALRFVAQHFKNNVRELEGALNCLATFQSMTGKRICLTTARNVLADLERDCKKIVRISDVEQSVCSLFGVTPKDLKSASRSHAVSFPRMLAMFLTRKHTQSAFSEIGRYFGGRNHSTVMSAHKKVESLLKGGESIKVISQVWPLAEVIENLEQHLLAC